MVNFNLEGLDKLESLGENNFGSFIASIGVLAVFFAILVGVLVVLLWVFGSIGLMNLAKKKNIQNAWLAFVPIGRSYLIGKLGFEIFDSENKNKTTFMWITLGLGAASFVLGNSNGDLDTLVRYALLFFESWAFYNMFKNLNPKHSIVYTVFTALTGTLLGGVFLYVMKYEDSVDADNNSKNETKEADIVEEKKTIDTKKTTKKEDNKLNFCDNCGAKLAKTAKFCSECGKKIN